MQTLHKNRTFSLKNQYGLALDGVNECVNIDTALTPLKTTTVGTWSIWAKPSDITTADTFLSFGDTDAATVMMCYMASGANAGKISCYENKTGANAWLFTTDNVVLANNVWAHIVLVQNGTSPVLYVNNVLQPITFSVQTDKTIWFNYIPGLDNGRIGADVWNNGGIRGPFFGNIDEVTLFNTNFTAAEVSELYNGGKPMNANAHSKAANLVAYYRLGDPTAIHDGTNWQIPNSKGGLENKKSVLFDGVAEYVNIDDARTALASTTVGTWSAWVKPVDATPASPMVLIAFGDTDANTFIEYFINTAGTLEAEGNKVGIQWYVRTTSVAFSDNTWTHVVLVQDGVSPVLYVNGVAVALTWVTTTDKTLWFNSNPNIDNGRLGTINYNSGGNQYFFNGNIDEVRFYNTALTAPQITALYNLGNPAEAKDSLTDANLISHWRMGDAPLDTATVIEDVYGSNNGTGVNLEAADLEYDAPMLGVSVNMEAADLITGVNLIRKLTATGGTITYSGGYTIHTFTSSGTFTSNDVGEVEYLVVAGGGGGGGNDGGGGGGGGYRPGVIAVTAQAYTITVGAGGAKGVGETGRGSNGGDSIFSTITSSGGGGGGVFNNKNGLAGGSGGGGGMALGGGGTGGAGNTPSTTPSQGNNGGNSESLKTGGGGGASAVGQTGAAGGQGGAGTASSISGSSVTRGGGGGGGYTASAGGAGGGGAGAGTAGNGVAGTAETGGGGGGGGDGVGNTGGDGGSGIVIIRYLT